MHDPLVEAIFSAIRREPASIGDRWRAVMRAGKIAEAYCGEPEESLSLLFFDALHNHCNDHSSEDRGLRN